MQRIVAAIYGAYRLFRLDARGMDFFDLTVAGFWGSFNALIIALPFEIVTLVAPLEPAPNAGDAEASWTWHRIAVEALDYVAPWVVFPLFALGATKLLGLTSRYVPYIIALNWSAVPAAALGAFVLLVTDLTLGWDVAAIAMMLLMAYFLYVEWFLTRTALRTTTGIAVALVVAEVVLVFILYGLIDLLR